MALSAGRAIGLRGLVGGDGDEHRSDRADDRDEHVHVGRQMEEAMPETEGDAVGVEVCGGVVAEELGIAEDEAGLVIVIGVPRCQWEDRSEERERASQVR